MMLFLYSDAVKFYIKILVDYSDTTRYYQILPWYNIAPLYYTG